MTPDKTKTPQPFAKIIYNENTGTQKLIDWMKKIIADKIINELIYPE